MKNFLIGLMLLSATQISQAFERPFRIDHTSETVKGYSIAWGIPGKKLDFEYLDTLSDYEIEKHLDISSVKNFLVDVQTNSIIKTLTTYDENVSFFVGEINYGNHFRFSVHEIAIQNVEYQDVMAVIEQHKWSSSLTKFFILDRRSDGIKAIEVDAKATNEMLSKKLRQSILPANLDLFDTGAENVSIDATKFLDSVGQVNVFTFTYEHPKSEDNILEVVVTAKLKYENGKVIPYVLNVKQRQY